MTFGYLVSVFLCSFLSILSCNAGGRHRNAFPGIELPSMMIISCFLLVELSSLHGTTNELLRASTSFQMIPCVLIVTLINFRRWHKLPQTLGDKSCHHYILKIHLPNDYCGAKAELFSHTTFVLHSYFNYIKWFPNETN